MFQKFAILSTVITFYCVNVHTKITLSLTWQQILIYRQFGDKIKSFGPVGTKLYFPT